MKTEIARALAARAADALQMWTIYERPKDYPESFVVREWWLTSGGIAALAPPVAVVGTLDEARAAVPAGKRNLGRPSEVDPVIVEVWL